MSESRQRSAHGRDDVAIDVTRQRGIRLARLPRHPGDEIAAERCRLFVRVAHEQGHPLRNGVIGRRRSGRVEPPPAGAEPTWFSDGSAAVTTFGAPALMASQRLGEVAVA